MRPESRWPVTLLLVGLVAALLVMPFSPLVHERPTADKNVSEVRIVEPIENGSAQLWPYTSRAKSFSQATLPINLVVHTDASTVYRLLATERAQSAGLYWNETAGAWQPGPTNREEVTVNGTGIHWGEASGANRYLYVVSETGWMDATYQLHDGPYFGSRYHLRLYQGGSGNTTWTAIQAHHEYWDWFQLRHDVDSLSKARHYVERDFLGSGLLAGISRERWANGGAIDADGWVTVIELKPWVVRGPRPALDPPTGTGFEVIAAGFAALFAGRSGDLAGAGHGLLERLRGSGLRSTPVALLVSTAFLPLVVRIGAIELERALPAASPVVVGAPFYLLLVLGLPAAAVLFSRSLPASEGFGLAMLGLGTGILMDYAYLGINAIPYGALVQRIVLLFGIGLLAAGGSRWQTNLLTRNQVRITGALVWAWGLLWPLVG